jgi:hypothetical protein
MRTALHSLASIYLPVICAVARHRIAKMPRRVLNEPVISRRFLPCRCRNGNTLSEDGATNELVALDFLCGHATTRLARSPGCFATCERFLAGIHVYINRSRTSPPTVTFGRSMPARVNEEENRRRTAGLDYESKTSTGHNLGMLVGWAWSGAASIPVSTEDVAYACARLQSSTVVSSLPSP